MPRTESQNESSLYFLSTQIQSRHEDQERVDSSLSRLNRFKNVPEVETNTHVQDAKVKKSKRKKTQPNSRKITSISAFVRETLGNKKISNTQGILDYFTGDSKRVNEFISKIESATATPHLLSRKSAGDHTNVLFSEAEWKAFVENLQLRFPNLSNKNKKSLKVVTKQLEMLRRSERLNMDDDERTSQLGKTIWTQASRQPSSELTPEDIRWLYDLDEHQLMNETTIDDREPSYQGPSCLTLSQVLGESQVQGAQAQGESLVQGESQVDTLHTYDSWNDGQETNLHPDFVEDSEPDMEEFTETQMEKYMNEVEPTDPLPLSEEPVLGSNISVLTPLTPERNSKPGTTSKGRIMSPHQKPNSNSSSVDVLTSIAFAPTFDSTNAGIHVESSAESQIEDVFKTPTKWPDHLQISSSPLSSKKDSPSDPNSVNKGSPLRRVHQKESESEYLQLSPTKGSKPHGVGYMSDVVEYHGPVELTGKSRFILKSLPKELYQKQPQEHISDSEDETHEVSFIGIIKPVNLSSELMHPAQRAPAYLQVPSSP